MPDEIWFSVASSDFFNEKRRVISSSKSNLPVKWGEKKKVVSIFLNEGANYLPVKEAKSGVYSVLVCSKITKPFQKRACLAFTRDWKWRSCVAKPWLLPELWILFLLPPSVISCPLEKSVIYISLFYPTWSAKLKQISVCCQVWGLFFFF